ncbi:hypothetical protein EJB05_16633 [Eragrostis curvula]|uniref:Uncharacterized protein n=1 Tax=Eragrostis curvula TaxID=38414 RepID=A0A5J9VEN5_9POAL|nr:hypothetical protein EJB05_16633 [Eragrostis curvula]
MVHTQIDHMGTFAVRRAWPLAAILLLALLLRGNAALARPKLRDPDLPWKLNDAFWENKTADAVSATIARRAAAAGYSYTYARWRISQRCPRRTINAVMGAVASRCYAEELRQLEESAKPPPPPPPPESPEDAAQRGVLEILRICPITINMWPETIVNPLIPSRPQAFHWQELFRASH